LDKKEFFIDMEGAKKDRFFKEELEHTGNKDVIEFLSKEINQCDKDDIVNILNYDINKEEFSFFLSSIINQSQKIEYKDHRNKIDEYYNIKGRCLTEVGEEFLLYFKKNKKDFLLEGFKNL
jgi:hypothetical protein